MADWFRWWHGTVTDTKFLWVSRKSGQRPGDVNAVWCALLEYASQSEMRGTVEGFDAESMDCFLGVEDGTTQRIIDVMRAKGLVDQDGALTGWDRRQPKREDSGGDEGGPMSNTERSRLSRANKRIEELENRLNELAMQRNETQCNAMQRNETQCNAMQRNETHATARREEKRVEEKEPSTSLSSGAHESENSAQATRKGSVCRLLRDVGMADAAPHYLPDDVWEKIFAKRTDEEIVEVAKAKMASMPNQRIGLKYIAPALLDDPIQINARASPDHPGRRKTLTETRAQTIAALTGRNRSHERQNANERDITGESTVVG